MERAPLVLGLVFQVEGTVYTEAQRWETVGQRADRRVGGMRKKEVSIIKGFKAMRKVLDLEDQASVHCFF